MLSDILRNDSRFGTPKKDHFFPARSFFPDCNIIQIQSPGVELNFWN